MKATMTSMRPAVKLRRESWALRDAAREAVRLAIGRVSEGADDLSADRAEADRIVAAVRPLRRDALVAVLVAAGLEGVRPTDRKAALIRRLHNRLTARVRAHERAEV